MCSSDLIICDKRIDQLTEEYPMDRGLMITLLNMRPELLGHLKAMEGITSVAMADAFTLELTFTPEKHTAFEIVKEVNDFAQIQDFKLTEPSIERMIEKIYRSGEVKK